MVAVSIGVMSTAPALYQVSDAELVDELQSLETQLHATWAQMLSVVAEIDSRGAAATVGYGSTMELLRAVAGIAK